MGIVANQKIKIRWSGRNKKYYEDRGYIFTKMNDEFLVNVKDISENSPCIIKVTCDVCGIQLERRNTSITKSRKNGIDAIHCQKCKGKDARMKQKVDFQKIENEFNERNYTLLAKESEYVNNRTKLKYICNKHKENGIQEINWSNFHSHKKGCRFCKSEKLSDIFRKDFDTVKKDFELCGFILLEDDYTNGRSNLKCRCIECNEISYKKYSHIITYLKTGKNAGCIHCFKKNNRGENHASWNPDITMEERILNRDYYEYKEWRLSVFERDDYTCQVCGIIGHELNAHHKDGYGWCKDRRLDVSNGVTLCEECHDDFHKNYGIKNNTEEQFNKWILGKESALVV